MYSSNKVIKFLYDVRRIKKLEEVVMRCEMSAAKNQMYFNIISAKVKALGEKFNANSPERKYTDALRKYYTNSKIIEVKEKAEKKTVRILSDDEIMLCDIPISKLGLSAHVKNSFAAAGITYLGQAVQLDEKHMLQYMGNFGKRALTEIKDAAAEKGFSVGIKIKNYVIPEERADFLEQKLEFLDISIYDLGLKRKAIKSLENKHLTRLADIANQPEQKIRHLLGVGKNAGDLIANALYDAGLCFGMNINYVRPENRQDVHK